MAKKMKVEDVNRLTPVGAAKKYTVKRGETLVIEDQLPENALFLLVYINDGMEGIDIGMPNGGRRFVPTFDQAKADNELIVQWSNLGVNAEPEERANDNLIKIRGHVIKDLGTISINGEGFESVDIEVYAYEPEQDFKMTRSRQALESLVESHYKRTIAYFPNQAAKDPEELKAQIRSDLLASYGLKEEDLLDDTIKGTEDGVIVQDSVLNPGLGHEV
ncbi:hypothetical protein PQD71_gp120 [Kosakonia phage Kc263]|uniref:Uncharacterized protein n=1 Tax=Kosakonia phage Kc263 TaxID=2863194 RepID=A0AAE7WF94_9CAUD|nr:hypothetical protein PQD71_gp120 [Kosakonia phage Kc263]QYN80013.1 hypothetical protein [Kosakonia phage Kc263]